MGALRHLVVLAAVLAIVITTVSAFIRLSQAGIGCREWPACYAAVGASTAPEPAAGSAVALARGLHRIAASTLGIVLLVIAFVGWEKLAAVRARWNAVALVALAVFLAWLGQYTPSPLPAVTLGNLLGGFCMLALLVWLLVAGGTWNAGLVCPGPVLWAAVAAVVLEIALGGMVSARSAALACPSIPDCSGSLWFGAGDLQLLNPFHEDPLPREVAALKVVHLAHRWVALAVIAASLAVALACIRRGGKTAGAILLTLTVGQTLLGFAMVLKNFPLLAALAHNLFAALILASLAALAFAERRGSKSPNR